MTGGENSRRRPARRLVALLTGGMAIVVAGCGNGRPDASTVAKPADPMSSTAEPRRQPKAVEPIAGHHADAEDANAGARRKSAAQADQQGALFSPRDRASFKQLAASLDGAEGLAVSATGLDQRVERVGSLLGGVAWSTSKVPVAMAVIDSGHASSQQANLTSAITASDNAAATRLWSSLGGGQTAARAADDELRKAGDHQTSIEYRRLRGDAYTPFGQTAWTLKDQLRFTAGLPCSKAGRAVLELMAHVADGQSWGIGAAGVPAGFKGGWGPGSRLGAAGGYLDRQMGIMTVNGKPLAVAAATIPADGSHESGTDNLTAIARWLIRHADTAAVPSDPKC